MNVLKNLKGPGNTEQKCRARISIFYKGQLFCFRNVLLDIDIQRMDLSLPVHRHAPRCAAPAVGYASW